MSGILDPMAPLTKAGIHAVAAGAAHCLGIDISKLSEFMASNLWSNAFKNNLEVDLGIPQSTKQKISGWDNE